MSFGRGSILVEWGDDEAYELLSVDEYNNQEELNRDVVKALEENRVAGVEFDGIYGADYTDDVSAKKAVRNARENYSTPLTEQLSEILNGNRKPWKLASPERGVGLKHVEREDGFILMKKL
ncbi:MAG: hypothetical protein ABEK16_06400 [Candidatus Nanohalobium sp.]